jgi:Protein of unknown function (DUF3987)
LSIWDEGNQFLDSMGAYKPSAQGYDKAMYLELYNAPSVYVRTLKTGNFIIEDPRLNIALSCHPRDFCDMIENEKRHKGDGLAMRFLFCTPSPEDEIIDSSLDVARSSFQVLLFIVYLIHSSKQKYVFNEETQMLFEEQRKTFNSMTIKCSIKLPYIR